MELEEALEEEGQLVQELEPKEAQEGHEAQVGFQSIHSVTSSSRGNRNCHGYKMK